jgi:hypothetical protein
MKVGIFSTALTCSEAGRCRRMEGKTKQATTVESPLSRVSSVWDGMKTIPIVVRWGATDTGFNEGYSFARPKHEIHENTVTRQPPPQKKFHN